MLPPTRTLRPDHYEPSDHEETAKKAPGDWHDSEALESHSGMALLQALARFRLLLLYSSICNEPWSRDAGAKFSGIVIARDTHREHLV